MPRRTKSPSPCGITKDDIHIFQTDPDGACRWRVACQRTGIFGFGNCQFRIDEGISPAPGQTTAEIARDIKRDCERS